MIPFKSVRVACRNDRASWHPTDAQRVALNDLKAASKRPAFDAFYATLTDDQKAALNRAGPGIGVGGGGTGGKRTVAADPDSRCCRHLCVAIQTFGPTPRRSLSSPTTVLFGLSFSGADRIEFSGTTGVLVAGRHQLATKRIERSESSRTVAATLPKNSVSPAGRPTPMTIRL
jgi:hypothetical protein